jgi:putative ABC transport system permease protein
LGFVLGLTFQKLALYTLSTLADEAYSYNLNIHIIDVKELYLFAGILAVGFLASLLPSLQAFRLNISKTLSDA